MRERIRSRGRGYEQSIGADYLIRLQERYLDHLQKKPGSRVLVVDLEQHDLLRDARAFDQLMALIEQEVPEGHRVATL
ncbi:MAG: deoxynucleoside kinase [Flavobacteriales bacterium]|nr:deoxynucleoside kinase [Flavobacteriales bacterium]